MKTSPESFQISFKYSQPYGDGLSGLDVFPKMSATSYVAFKVGTFKLGWCIRCFRSLHGKLGPAEMSKEFSETIVVEMPCTNWRLGMPLDIALL